MHDIISNLDEAVNRGHKQTNLIIKDFAKAFQGSTKEAIAMGLEGPSTGKLTRGSLCALIISIRWQNLRFSLGAIWFVPGMGPTPHLQPLSARYHHVFCACWFNLDV